MVLTLVGGGLDFNFVVDQDLYSFNSLIEAHFRILARARVEEAQTSQLAAQGTGKDLQKWLKKRWFPLMSRTQEATDDSKSFLNKFGKGI